MIFYSFFYILFFFIFLNKNNEISKAFQTNVCFRQNMNLFRIKVNKRFHIVMLHDYKYGGIAGDVLFVKAAFANNFLIPLRKARMAEKDDYIHLEKTLFEEEIALNLRKNMKKFDIFKNKLIEKNETLILYRPSRDGIDEPMEITRLEMCQELRYINWPIIERDIPTVPFLLSTYGFKIMQIRLLPGVFVPVKLNIAENKNMAKRQADEWLKKQDNVNLEKNRSDISDAMFRPEEELRRSVESRQNITLDSIKEFARRAAQYRTAPPGWSAQVPTTPPPYEWELDESDDLS
eukprot:GHVL01009673.1.p1 GENE.GHVL01009673.1~~GHVL01009673.1.p1  ORF type:complete len:291 (+),score=60.19 GHVL01009673.1:97-969(+)